MSSSYRSALRQIFSYMGMGYVGLRRDGRVDRGGILEPLEIRTLFSGSPPTVTDVPTITQLHGTVVSIPLSAFTGQYTDPDSDPLAAVVIHTLPAGGTLTVGNLTISAADTSINASDLANASLTFTPADASGGTITFAWEAFDGTNLSNVANVTIAYNDPNAPSVSNVTKVANENGTLPFTSANFTAQFTDADVGDTLRNITITTLPGNGTLMLGNATVSVNQVISSANITNLTYVPNRGFTGADSFGWNADDGELSAGTPALVNLTVNPPHVTDITLSQVHGNVVSIPLSAFTGNFTDPQGAPLQSVTIHTLPSPGGSLFFSESPAVEVTTADTTLTLSQFAAANNTLSLRPADASGAPDASGTSVTFTWEAFDGSNLSNVGNVTINFTDANAPTINSNVTTLANLSVADNTSRAFTSGQFASYFLDADAGNANLGIVADTFHGITVTSLPSNGTLKLGNTTVTLNEKISSANISLLTYVPNRSYHGPDSFAWTLDDGDLSAAGTSIVSLTVTPAPSASDIAPITQLHGNGVIIPKSAFANAFFDPLSLPLASITIHTVPTKGVITVLSTGKVITVADTTITASDLSGGLVFTPTDPTVTGDSFMWEGSDGAANGTAVSNLANVTLDFVDANAPVLSNPPAKGAPENGSLTFSAIDFTASFSDADVANSTTGFVGDTLQNITITTLPAHGKLTLNGDPVTANQTIPATSLSSLAYVPNSAFTGQDSFAWNADDGILSAATPVVTNLTVALGPTLTPELVNVGEGIPHSFTLAEFAQGYAGPNGANLSAIKLTLLPSNGTLTFEGQPAFVNEVISASDIGNLTYTSAALAANTTVGAESLGWNGTSDGLVFASSSTLLALGIAAPTVADATVGVGENRTHTFAQSDFAFSSDFANLSISPQIFEIDSLPTHGTLKVNGAAVGAGEKFVAGLTVTYTPNAGFIGSDSFTWTLSTDGVNFAADATETLTVAAPTLSNVTKFGGVTSPVTFTASDFSSAFTDGDNSGTLQTVRITKLPTHGTLTLGGAAVTVNQNIPVGNLGTLTYTPTTLGTDSFSWNGSDGSAFAAAPALVNLTILSAFGVTGNGVPIVNNSNKPTVTNFTDFASWTLGADASMGQDTRTFTIRNTTSTTITLSNATISNQADFIVVTQPGTLTLAPGGTTTITIQFRPISSGVRTSTVTIANSSGSGPFVFTIQGTGIATNKISAAATSNGTPVNVGGIVQEGTTKAGSGASASNGHIVSIKYTGYFADGGTIFDSSANHANTVNGLTFRLDDDYADRQPFLTNDQANLGSVQSSGGGIDLSVIAGWEFGLQGIKPGEKRTLVINTAAAYGAASSTNQNPANLQGQTLIFDVQCVLVDPKPQLAVASIVKNNGNNTIFPTPSGQTTVSAQDGTLLSISNTSTSSTATQDFYFFTIAADNASGAPLTNFKFGKVPATLKGDNKKDFTITQITGQFGPAFEVSYHPAAAGNSFQTVHIHTNDPVHPDYNFRIEGSATKFVDLAPGFVPAAKLPKQTVVSGSGQAVTVPVTITNTGTMMVPPGSKTNIQVYATDASGNMTLVQIVQGVNVGGLVVGGTQTVFPEFALPFGLASGTYTFTAVVNQASTTSNTTISNLVTVPTTFDTIVQGAGSGANQTMTANDSADTGTFPLLKFRSISVAAGNYAIGGNLGNSTITTTVGGAARGNVLVNLQNLGNIFTVTPQQYSVDLIAHPLDAVDDSQDVTLSTGSIVAAPHVGPNGTVSTVIPLNYTGHGLVAGKTYVLEAVVTLQSSGDIISGPMTLQVDKNSNQVVFIGK